MLEEAKKIIDARWREAEKRQVDLEQRILKWERVIDPLAAEFAGAAMELDEDPQPFGDSFSSSFDGWKISVCPVELNPDRSGARGYGYRGAEMIVVGTDGTWAWFRKEASVISPKDRTERVTSKDTLASEGVLWTDQATDEELRAVLRPIFVERLARHWYTAKASWD